MNRAFRGVWIDRAIWLRKDLSCVDKCLLTEITSLDMSDSHCFASNAYFAEFLAVSVPTITRSVKKLEDLALIKCYSEKTHSGTKRIIIALIKMMIGSNQNDQTPTNQNDEHINTELFNNTVITKECGFDKDFNSFYSCYPKKRSKESAKKAFKKIWNKPGKPKTEDLVNIIEKWKKTEEWQKDNYKYVPYPASWLNACGWEDELTGSVKEKQNKQPLQQWTCNHGGAGTPSVITGVQCKACGEIYKGE